MIVSCRDNATLWEAILGPNALAIENIVRTFNFTQDKTKIIETVCLLQFSNSPPVGDVEVRLEVHGRPIVRGLRKAHPVPQAAGHAEDRRG